ncbi:unnamed protein product, partial [Linum tenue]
MIYKKGDKAFVRCCHQSNKTRNQPEAYLKNIENKKEASWRRAEETPFPPPDMSSPNNSFPNFSFIKSKSAPIFDS